MITNLTKHTTISETELRATSICQQARGLMFRTKHNLIMTFEKPRKISLHNFFVFYPLDILLLDEQKQIIEIKYNFKPFTFYTAQQKATYVIELAHKNNNYNVKDILEF